jgi:polysaccharide export outer membrane protein
MKNSALILFAMVIFLDISHAASGGHQNQAKVSSDYIVGAGDVIEISVWKNDSLSSVATVLPDGTIALPLIDEYMAMGKTLRQIRKEITDKISKYIQKPEMSVSIRQVNSMWVYVVGKVIRGGRFQLNGNINVLQALSMAEGVTPYADSKNIKIIRESGNESQVFNFNFKDVLHGKNLATNIHLKKGDVVIVP